MLEDNSLFANLVAKLGGRVPWHKLPKVLGLIQLYLIRRALREHNLHDTEFPPLPTNSHPENTTESQRRYRSFDGTHNDLNYPTMGAKNARFGRNFPLDRVHPDADNLMNPSPREVSRKLMTRDQFQPATILNLLAAAWIQFQVHDWFAHKTGVAEVSHDIPLAADDAWPGGKMNVPKTPAEASAPGNPPSYANINSHWWDGSQLYGSDEATAQKLRTGFQGKMKIGDAALLPMDVEGVEMSGFTDNWWVGLSLLHSLFVSEHNAICDRLHLEHPDWDDERLFQQGRLIVAALLAKIHTVEWTPAILPHPTSAASLRINWDGVVGAELQEIFSALDDNELLGGIVGSETNHYGVPYNLTEEFAAVYRMHPLMPDDFSFCSLRTGKELGRHTLKEVSLGNTRQVMEQYELRDLFYSFGIAHPGALRLHNYPRGLQELEKNGQRMDLAAIDILRDRERGVPRYNEFRALLRLVPVATFEELTDNPQWAAEMKEVYNDDIQKVDVMTGMFAEPLIEGFGFSETAFRIFILMASRRLNSDRFFTSDFTEETYTKTGLDWIKDNSMITILLRHHPALEASLRGVENAFQPWKPIHNS